MIIYLAMIFVVFETLSMIFNQYFLDISIFGKLFPLNISVMFFCLGFFILDMVTELYNVSVADKLIYGKVICQIAFIGFAEIGIMGAGLQNTQLSQIIATTPWMILNSVIASMVGYKITVFIMQKLKFIYQGKYLMMRYLCSTLPGEIMFSLIFSALSFSKGKTFAEFSLIFLSLTFVKFVLSLLFSMLVVPLTMLLRNSAGKDKAHYHFMPFR